MRRPPNTADPGALPCQCPCRCASLAVSSAVIISPITARPTVVHIASSPSRATLAIAPSDRRSSSGNSTASLASSRSTRRTAATCFFIGGGPLPLSVDLAVARHLPRRQVSGGGPPPHFNKTGDNLPEHRRGRLE